MAGGSSLPYKLAKPNLNVAWHRMYLMMKPMDDKSKFRLVLLQAASTLSWPALAYFGHYTMKMDYPEHAARHQLVNKKMPYMANPANIQYKWGTPCTLFDFECAYKNRQEKGLI